MIVGAPFHPTYNDRSAVGAAAHLDGFMDFFTDPCDPRIGCDFRVETFGKPFFWGDGNFEPKHGQKEIFLGFFGI